jgi:hypothetical protein
VFKSVINYRLRELFTKREDSEKLITALSPVGRSVFPIADGSDSGAISVLKAWAGKIFLIITIEASLTI